MEIDNTIDLVAQLREFIRQHGDSRLLNLTDQQLSNLYSMYSAENACHWITLYRKTGARTVQNFSRWAYERPIDTVIKD